MEREIAPKTEKAKEGGGIVFNFQRMSGLDQITLKTDEEWRNLDKLDPKLWMALSCPTQGLEFSSSALELLDTNNDGRVRANEVLEAVRWVCQRFIHPGDFCEASDNVALDQLRDDTEEGKNLALAARLVISKNGKKEDESISLGEIEDVLAEAAGYPFNGDGIVTSDSAREKPPASGLDMDKFVQLALSIVGAKRDASGKPGLDLPLASEFKKRLEATKAWRDAIKNADLPLGEKTGEAWALLGNLSPKIDDYFYRCAIAAFSPDSLGKLNEAAVPVEDDREISLVAGSFNRELLERMPLARISDKKELAFGEAINPVYADDLQAFQKLLAPLLKSTWKEARHIDENSWKAIKERFASYAETLRNKPDYGQAPFGAGRVEGPSHPTLALADADDELGRACLPLDPGQVLSGLSDEELASLLSPDYWTAFEELVKQDLAAPPLTAIQDLRKAALFHAHLYTFLMNFLSFLDFYNPQKRAIFQAGTLYLDSRACLLCVPVADLDTHARLAEQSHLCLIYCACTRKESDGSEKTATIAAALTGGNLVSLIDGKHGLFVDNHGKEWDTRIIRIIHNPISLKEAAWAPYIRAANMANEQIQKFIATKETAISKMTGQAARAIMPGGAQTGEQKASFDFAKGAGIFAAMSVALSVLSAAFAYVAHSFVSLGWWWPVALFVIFLCISGPSVIMAWFKLRKRSLGPLLDASGWAVNQGAPINLPMGASLTQMGKLPPNANCNLDDPYGLSHKIKVRKRARRIFAGIILTVLAIFIGFGAWLWLMGEPAWLLKLRVMAGI